MSLKKISIRFLGLPLFLCLGLISCAQTPDVEPVPEIDWVGYQVLDRANYAPTFDRQLDVAIRTFDVTQTGDSGLGIGGWIFDEILEIESQYLPTVLRDTLLESNHWGVVRVLPKEDLSMDLQVTANILHSDGLSLEVDVFAIDNTGRTWLNQRYSERYRQLDEYATTVAPAVDHLAKYEDPFQNLYNKIANDLFAFREKLEDEDLLNIQRVSEVLHAKDLSPEAFGDLLETDDQGFLIVSRLLAENDPMQERVGRMQLRHNIFIDTLDEYYNELNQDMQPVYDLWRYYSREQILEIEQEDKVLKTQSSKGFAAISNNYYRYTANKMFEQEWVELASGFTSELEPSVIELNNKVYGLSGSVEDQYIQWRQILREFYRLETGR